VDGRLGGGGIGVEGCEDENVPVMVRIRIYRGT
jgi:hypothetical protein